MDGVEDEEEHLIQSVQVMEKMLFNTYLDMSLCIYIYIYFCSNTVRISEDLKFKVPGNIQVS